MSFFLNGDARALWAGEPASGENSDDELFTVRSELEQVLTSGFQAVAQDDARREAVDQATRDWEARQVRAKDRETERQRVADTRAYHAARRKAVEDEEAARKSERDAIMAARAEEERQLAADQAAKKAEAKRVEAERIAAIRQQSQEVIREAVRAAAGMGLVKPALEFGPST